MMSFESNNNIKCGVGCEIHESVEISDGAHIELGDHCYIGPGVKIMPGNLKLGDYSKIFDRTFINPMNGIQLGHLAWVGQNCVLDGTGGISAGNFLGAGINTALYSHIRHGDITEGCLYENEKKMIIGDDVWFVGMCLVSPIIAEDKSMAMLGSTIVKNMECNHVYGGSPAKDLTSKIGNPWKNNGTAQKLKLVKDHLDHYCNEVEPGFEKDSIVVVDEFPKDMDDRSFYNVKTRQYTKNNTRAQVSFNKWLFKYRAKFVPLV
jgi:acetyltransferase-like isoleucine patch superfamily enzyme